MKELPHSHACFVCGESNPLGLNLRSETDGRTVRVRFSFGPGHVGFRDTVHGGLTATVLDELMSWACTVPTHRFAYCAGLSVRYRAPVRPGRPLTATAELVADHRGRLYEAKSELRDEQGVLLATATGKYVPIPETDLPAMAADMIGRLPWDPTGGVAAESPSA